MYKNLKNLKKHHQILYSLFIALGLIGIWRGIWRLMDIYILPEQAVASSFATLALGIVILAVTHHRLG